MVKPTKFSTNSPIPGGRGGPPITAGGGGTPGSGGAPGTGGGGGTPPRNGGGGGTPPGNGGAPGGSGGPPGGAGTAPPIIVGGAAKNTSLSSSAARSEKSREFTSRGRSLMSEGA